MKFRGQFTHDGGLNFGPRREEVIKYAKEHPNERFELSAQLPESPQMRGFYFGGVLGLWAYLDGKDYTDPAVIDTMHRYAAQEFNSEVVIIDGDPVKVAGTTVGKLRDGFIDKIIDHLEEQYGIDRMKALDPEHYKYYRDAIRMEGVYNTYIDYQLFLNRIPRCERQEANAKKL